MGIDIEMALKIKSIWLRIGASGRPLKTRWWNFKYRKMRGIYWLAEELSFPGRTVHHGVIYIKIYTLACDL